MTTIIFVAIGILLAAAAAIFVIFYGGAAFNESSTRSEAARLVTEGQQISYATEMFYRQEERLPGQKADGSLDGTLALQELKTKDYLPIAPVGSHLTNVDGWKMEYGTDGMIYSKLGSYIASTDTSASDSAKKTSEAALNVCRQARKQLQFADFNTVYKCDGTDYPAGRYHPEGSLPDREPCCIRG